MRIKYFSFLAAAALVGVIFVGATSSPAFAQVVQASGLVKLKQADGTEAPIKDASIVLYRTDIKGEYKTKTDKSGRYIYAGIPFGGTFTIAVSAPGARPTFLTDVRISQRGENNFTLEPGDGAALTLEQIRASMASSTGGAPSPSSGKESAADRAKREEMMRKNAEIEAKNKKISESNEVVGRTFKAGNEALMAKRFDDAIRSYDEGIAADPEQPALLTNKSVALKARGAERYNAAVRLTDDAAKNSGLEAARKDFRDAAEAATKAVELLKAAPAETEPARQAQQASNKLASMAARAEAMRLVVTKVDPAQADAGLTSYKDYIALETDATKKAKAETDAAQMLLDAGASDRAVAEFERILVASPENIDASLGAGLALFQSGDKAKYQQAANHLQRFVDRAPDTHPLKSSAKESLEYLKNEEKVQPQRTTPTRTGARRRS